jgi:hypothetical protein
VLEAVADDGADVDVKKYQDSWEWWATAEGLGLASALLIQGLI